MSTQGYSSRRGVLACASGTRVTRWNGRLAGAGGLPEFPLPRGNAGCDCHWDKPRAQWVSNSTGLPLSPEPGMHSGGSGVCIVSIARGDDYKSSLGDALLQNKRAFCAACGYRCVLVDRDFATGRHPSWDKILAVQHALNSSACLSLIHI